MKEILNSTTPSERFINLLKIYYIVKLLLLALLDVFLLTLCILLICFSKEINHFMYHAFDCCHFMF